MDLENNAADLAGLIFQISTALLFGLVFLFLWRQSKIVYFGLWSVAWAAKSAALPLAYAYLAKPSLEWLAPFALMEFAFTVLLFAAGGAGFSGPIRNWRSPLKIVLGFPILVGLAYALGGHTRPRSWQAVNAAALCAAYLYNRTGIRSIGVGGHAFRFSLLGLAAVFLYDAVVLAYLSVAANPATAGWAHMLGYSRLCGLALDTALTFAALAMWIENQQQRLKELGAEIERVRPDSIRSLDLDDLTGLLNHAALDRRIRETPDFDGVMVVCDIDNFKEVNDRYGHLAGDEILRSIGHLFHASIRQEDEAFRWGGDEFAILFHNQGVELVNQRMQELWNRLQTFRVRGYGMLPISFSWGMAQLSGRPLREVLDEADRKMYGHKGSRR
jgi:diguanylate cyclase (GGDEF)-like protein